MLGFLVFVVGALFVSDRYRLAWVLGDSMRPTFQTADLIVVERHAYLRHPPRRGDIVLARHQNVLIVKRVVGLPGEVIELIEGVLHVDGSPWTPDLTLVPGRLDIGRGLLIGQKYAVLGDNRALASEPTLHAVIARREIVGKVIATLRWPWKSGLYSALR